MSSRTKLLLGGALVVVLLAGAGIWWFLRDDAPAPVSLHDAVASVQDDGDTAPTGVAGRWSVDTTTGTFDFTSATGTFAGFRIGEELRGVGKAEAVGRTGDVTGSITIEGSTLTAASFRIDLTSITTNESRRDDRVQSALETGRFPTATFTLREPVDLGSAAGDGADVAVTAVGDLTIHGVTHQVRFPLEAKLVKSRIVVVGSLPIVFADYDVTVPSSAVVVRADDHGTVELQLLLAKG